jgi:hypothetical protein
MRLARRVYRPAVLRLGRVRQYESTVGGFSLLLVAGFSQLAVLAKAVGMKHAEARFGPTVITKPGRQTAGLVTLWESPMNRA